MSCFKLENTDGNARAGIISTTHGQIPTPIFMPVGTQATVKSLDSDDLRALNAPIILANTYHLHLRPGEDLVEKCGGLHKFMNWDRSMLTDSGGFQVFSLNSRGNTEKQGKLVKIDDDGVTFNSHIDGSKHRFTPESSIEIQHKLGADIIMAFDECTPDDADKKYAKKAMVRTHEWAKKSLKYHQKNNQKKQLLFGIAQGANFSDLRLESTKFIASLDFDGMAVGGESIGYNPEATKNILENVIPIFPKDKPRYAMGVGASPKDLFEVVERGVDMFDCVSPTRLARNGSLYVGPEENKNFRLNIDNAEYRLDQNPIDKKCSCPVCQKYTRAYLHHLFATKELTAYRLATIHNLSFFLNLMSDIRRSIQEKKFLSLKKEWLG